jgi:hypothetical protein
MTGRRLTPIHGLQRALLPHRPDSLAARALGRWVAVLGSALAAALLAPIAATGAPKQELSLDLCAPEQQSFSPTVDNPYLPFAVGDEWILGGHDQGETIGLQITVLRGTERFKFASGKVDTRIVRETEWVDSDGDGVIDDDEDLLEVSWNFFAQTGTGTVCYFGEEVDIYEDGEVVSHEGAWRADDPGNAPGIFMPANPEVGMTFQQEVAEGIAEDRATIVKSGSATVDAGTFPQTITVRDFNPLDGSRSTKIYAFGVGLIRDDRLELRAS